MSTKSSLLTDLSVRTIVARAQRERRTIETRLGDGLELRAGVRKASFSLKFVDRRTGRQERLTLGYYPSIGLAEARRRAKEEQARIADPKVLANPARERRDISAMSTFKKLAELRLADGRLADTTTDFYRWSQGDSALDAGCGALFASNRAGRRSPKALRRCRTPGRLLRDGTVMQVRRPHG